MLYSKGVKWWVCLDREIAKSENRKIGKMDTEGIGNRKIARMEDWKIGKATCNIQHPTNTQPIPNQYPTFPTTAERGY
jgi:hypothetical protein